ncbi:MAG: tyrosine-type recombinase/integrase [Phycisphaerales bacterium]|nr:tyrosine-type recombinase/integrase [Phycisphaerales bacterium]
MTTAPSITTFSGIEVASMLDATPSAWWRAFIQLGVSTGLRVTEELWLSWNDVDFTAKAIVVAGSPVADPESSWEIPRPRISIHRERVVPLTSEASAALLLLREHADVGALVFVPDWRVEEIWPDISSSLRVSSSRLVPDIEQHFRWVQRLAPLGLARRLDVELDAIRWAARPLSALRATYAAKAARSVPPRELAERLGYACIQPVLRFYDTATATGRDA